MACAPSTDLSVHGFPNCFMLSIAQSGFTVNFPYLLDVQARHAGIGDRVGIGERRNGVRGHRRGGIRLGRHGCRTVRPPVHSGRRPAHPVTTTAKARRTPRRGRAASSSAARSNTPTSSPRRGRTENRRDSRSPGTRASTTHDPCAPIHRRSTAGVDPARTCAASRDHRGGIRWAGGRGRIAAQRHRRSLDRRTRRRSRRHVATEYLSGRSLRHPEPPVLVLLRAQSGMDPHVRLSAGDSRVPRVGRRRVRPPPPPHARHDRAHGAMEHR